jgi:CHAT domain-containing protein/Tfp pilus assembly protein PilF
LTATLVLSCGPALPHARQPPGTAPQTHLWEVGEERRLALGGDAGTRQAEILLYLDAPSYLLVMLEKRGIDVRLALQDPAGGEVASSMRREGPWTEEVLVALTPGAGRYRLMVTMEAGETSGGHVLLRLLDHHPAGPGDERRAAIERRRVEVLTGFEAGSVPPDAAVGTLTGMVRDLETLSDTKRRSDLLQDLGSLHKQAGRLDLAEAALAEALALRRRLGDPAGIADALYRLTQIQRDAGRLPVALASVEEAHRLAVETGDRRLIGMIDNTRGSVLRRSRDLQAAIEAYRSAAAAFRAVNEPLDEAIALQNLGLTILDTGDLTRGCPAVRAATGLLSELRFEDPGLLLNRGRCLRAHGLVDGAFRAYQRAYDLLEGHGSPHYRAMADLHMGALLAELGENDRAARMLRQALERLDPVWRAHVAMAHINLGWIELEEERPTAGEQEFQRALELGDASTEAEAMRGQGAALAAQGRGEEALEVLRQALALTRRGAGARRSEAETLRKIGALQVAAGKLEEAHAYLGEALAVAEGGEPAVVGAASSDLAHLEARLGRYDAALGFIEQAIEIRESLREEVSSPELRATYLSNWREDFSLLLELLRRAGRPADELLEVSERAHARTLQELLWEARSRPVGDPPPQLRRQQQQLEERLDALARQQVPEPSNPEERDELRARIDEVVDELKTLEWRMRSTAAGVTDAAPLPLGEIQELLADDEALLEFALGEERSFLFVVTSEGISVHPDLPPASSIADMVERMRRALRRPQRAWLPELWSAGHALYAALLAPAEAELSSVERLVIVPDRELFYLPFETLVLKDPGTEAPAEMPSHYALQHWQIGYVPAAKVLDRLRAGHRPAEHTAGTVKLVAFADSRGGSPMAGASQTSRSAIFGPLPASRREIADIAALLPPGESWLRLGSRASATELRQAPLARWIHFAVHGFFDPRHPMLSGLVMAEGELRAREIYDLRLDAELVVLSACETGLGEEVWGEELIGLSRAFFYAGVPTVTVSLWRVEDDSTARLMVAFYRRLIAGAGPVQALAEAKRQLLAEGVEHPFYWAPFIVIGQPRFEAP